MQLRRRRERRALAATTLMLAITSCSSGPTSIGGFGDTSTGPGVAQRVPSASTPNRPVGTCPTSLPSTGQQCTGSVACDYGLAANSACNDWALCDASGFWVSHHFAGAFTCPETWDEIPTGASCSDAAQVCAYDEGTCGCVVDSSDDVDAGADAGDTDAGDGGWTTPTGRWTCVRPASGCPARRPLDGAPCVNDMVCDYGTTTFGIPLTFECTSQQWLR